MRHIPGSDPTLVNAPLLIGAHYDGVGDDPGGDRIPGAADNAAGVAVVLEVARTLMHAPTPPRRPIILTAFDGEEVNALGSQAYAQPADVEHAYGHSKAEYSASAVEGLLILVAAFSNGWAAIDRLFHLRALE